MRLRSLLSHVRITQNLPFLMGRYVYEPLPSKTSIRLLELIPSKDRGRIQCSLKAFELDDAPLFKALSYTWGQSEISLNHSSTTARDGIAHCVSHRRDAKLPDLEGPEITTRSRRHHVICDGRLLNVTSNLRDALRMLSTAITMPLMPKIPTYYWIDALCVDQSNILERNIQVARMADIFCKASGVIVWLGREDEFTADALEVIQKVSAIPESDWPSVPYTSFYDSSALDHPSKPRLSYKNWLGFIALVNRPWFRRAWVVQEITLGSSPIVVCGTKVFLWEKLSKTLSFIKATKWYHHLQTEKLKHVSELRKHSGHYKRLLQSKLSVGMAAMFLNETRVAVAPMLTLDKRKTPRVSFTMLLQKHRYSKSTDPRDKVYALLGLASPTMAPFRTNPAAITPNYSMSVQQVYMATAKAFLTDYRNLTLLSHVEDSSMRRIADLPSWVPDYSVTLEPYPLPYRGKGHWTASGNLPWRMNTFRMDDGLLDVQGYCLDHIDQTSILSDESSDPSALWASIVRLALSLDLQYPSTKGSDYPPSRVEVLWRTLTTDTYAHACPAPPEVGALFIDYILNLQIRHRLMPWSSNEEFQPHHSPLSESIYPEWRTLLSLEPPRSAYSLDVYKKRLTKVVEDMFNGTYSPIGLAQLQHEIDQSGGRKRRLFKTRRGYLGTGSRSLKHGDEVWILHKGGLPFVLRPQQRFGHYRFVGEAFVYGVMHGEALEQGLTLHNITLE